MNKLKKGDMVKIIKPLEGFSMYGLRKGSVGKIMKQVSFRGKKAYQIRFKKAGKDLTFFHTELRKIKK